MPRSFRWFLLLPGALLASPGPAGAAGHPVVPGYERFFASGKNDLERAGRLLLSELACTRCHRPAEKTAAGKEGPNLDDVGRRARPGWLRRYLSNPHAIKPGATMPDLLASDPDREQKVEALVHLLASTGSLRHERVRPRDVAAGRTLYERVGCVACHGTRKPDGEPGKVLSTSVPLGELTAKYTLPGLTAFLQDPLHARPAGRMPRLLDAKEAKQVAAFLLQRLVVQLAGGKGTTTYAYYEGGWDHLPDFGKLVPTTTGIAQGFDLDVARRDSNYAIRFDAVLPIDRDGTYSFRLTSDDGSKLTIDGKVIVDNDGTHATQTKRGRVWLTKGLHKLTITFFQGGGEAVLGAQMSAPGFGTHDLGSLVAASEEQLKKKPAPRPNDPDTLDVRPELVNKGKALFASLGCASCHHLNLEGKPITSTRIIANLAKLDTSKGCLSSSPGKNVPRYDLSAGQRNAIVAALKSKPAAPSTATRVANTLLTFNCYACHARDKVGGPQEELNKSFQTTQPEMGDEARLPPPLDGVGAKLQPAYFWRILDQGVHDRPYMHTRMPGFGAGNVAHVVEDFASLDKLPAVGKVKFEVPMDRVKAQARHLVGAQAMGCIKCHTFAGQKAEGIQGIDMLKLPQRLRRDWFHAYVADPQRIRPGTRMPGAFTAGKSVLPDILDGTALTQIEAMWLYLEDGTKARRPVGIGPAFIPLVPTTSAIIYRNFIQGAGTRAIAVGYPEKVHLAFDANNLRLAMLWQGDFIDAARHWTDRGSGFEGPLGDHILHLPAGVSFAVLGTADTPWPTGSAKSLGQRFRGYRLTKDDRPTFLYQVGDVKIEDFSQPIVTGKEHTLKRTLTLTTDKPTDKLHFRAAAGDKIEVKPDGWFVIDGKYKVKATGTAGKIFLRKVGGRTELMLQVGFKDGKCVVVQEFGCDR
jgi:mono/diheme cytochrome c family protein